jgi:hypothetical protein
MSAAIDPTTPEPEPFFTDPRTLLQKLNVEKREWRPHQPQHECPAVISGLVLETGTYIDMNNEPVPTLRLLTDDLRTEWSIIGFHGWLKSGINKKQPREGDYVLLAYAGTKPSRKKGENDAHAYEVLVERNPETPVAETSQPVEETPDATATDPDTDTDIPF